MITRVGKILMLACALSLLSLVWALPSRAQDKSEKPVMYTYVAQWDVPRAQWPDIEKAYADQKTLMDKLVADGTIVGYGSFITTVHTVDGPTHGSWFQAMSMANLLKALQTVKASGGGMGPVFAASKHWDLLLESKQYGYQSGTFQGAYLRVSTWTVKPETGENMETFNKNYMVPLLDKLMADGAIYGYQIDEQNIHTDNPMSFNVAILANGGDGLDKFYAALDAGEKANPFADAVLGHSVDISQHRDLLAFVPELTHK